MENIPYKLQKNKEGAKQSQTSQSKQPEKSHQEIQKEIDALFKTFQTEGYTTQKKSNPSNKKKKKRKKKGNLQQK